MPDEEVIGRKYAALRGVMDERSRRIWAATEARAVGRGGFTAVLRATGMSSKTLARGLREVAAGERLEPGRVRRPGGGRKPAKVLFPELGRTLENLVEPVTRGDPESPLRWTCKSTRRLAAELAERGFDVSHTLVAQMLREAGYSLQANRKTREGASHPDRNAQFEHINATVQRHLQRGQPAISVDTKKKELVGDFKNAGREWRPHGRPQEVRVHDFLDKRKGKAIPYGVYDMGRNVGWVSVGVTHDTAAFAVSTIRRWWREMGRRTYAKARSLLITADSGGSNGNRVRLWKWELQRLADETGLTIHVCHLPPGTSKWNKIEHRLFSFITQNWRGQPLLSLATIVNLIASTKTRAGLRVRCVLDQSHYQIGRASCRERVS
jgi:transposase